MRETKAEEIPVFNLEGDKQGVIMKYYKYGLWHYRAIIFIYDGILSGVFYSLENARQFIKERS
tara:strand:- start:1401 stop:1589 length:189 start_codon:yes stop_codon:yes gene_type:complete